MNIENAAKEVFAGIALLMLGAFFCGMMLLPIAFVWWLVK